MYPRSNSQHSWYKNQINTCLTPKVMHQFILIHLPYLLVKVPEIWGFFSHSRSLIHSDPSHGRTSSFCSQLDASGCLKRQVLSKSKGKGLRLQDPGPAYSSGTSGLEKSCGLGSVAGYEFFPVFPSLSVTWSSWEGIWGCGRSEVPSGLLGDALLFGGSESEPCQAMFS